MRTRLILCLALLIFCWGVNHWVNEFLRLHQVVTGRATVHPIQRLLRREAAVLISRASSSESSLPKSRDSYRPLPLPSLVPFLQSPQELADGFFEERKQQWGIQAHHEWRSLAFELPIGTRVRYEFFQEGIPIPGLSIEIDIASDREVSLFKNEYRPLRRLDLSQPSMSSEEVIAQNSDRYSLDGISTEGVSRVIYTENGSEEPELCYIIPVIEVATNRSFSGVFRASDGQLVGRQSGREERVTR